MIKAMGATKKCKFVDIRHQFIKNDNHKKNKNNTCTIGTIESRLVHQAHNEEKVQNSKDFSICKTDNKHPQGHIM